MFGAPVLPESFWSKCLVDKSGCWIWIGALDTHGYGIIWNGERTMGAHRMAYLAMVGDIANGLVLDHEVCSLPCCVNPAHLVPKTHRENILRGDAPTAVNARKTHCPRGHELSTENIYRYGDGRRDCRLCRSLRATAG